MSIGRTTEIPASSSDPQQRLLIRSINAELRKLALEVAALKARITVLENAQDSG